MGKVKSSIRCKSTFQGDRCRFHVGHIELIADQPNAVAVQHMHAGQFTCWDDDGVKGKAIGAENHHRRNRLANRTSRQLTSAQAAVLPCTI